MRIVVLFNISWNYTGKGVFCYNTGHETEKINYLTNYIDRSSWAADCHLRAQEIFLRYETTRPLPCLQNPASPDYSAYVTYINYLPISISGSI